MASVHIGVLEGALGFSRVVAIKRLHGALSADERFVSMLIDEARLVSRIRHVNVVQTLDILERGPEIYVIMEYVRGAALSRLIELTNAKGELVPLPIAVPIMIGALRGLGAAHDATDLDGSPLGIVHRDVSPQNILVGVAGVPRVIDFGVARAVGRLGNTNTGEFKGKLAYAAPEQVAGKGGGASRRSDIFAAGIVLWELITGRRLFHRETQVETLRQVLDGEIRSPVAILHEDARMEQFRGRADVEALADVVMRALEREPHRRFETAEAMARSLEQAFTGVSAPAVGAWVQSVAHVQLVHEESVIARAEAAVSARVDSERRRLAQGRRSFTSEAGASGAPRGPEAETVVEHVPSEPSGAPASASASASASAPASASTSASAPASASASASARVLPLGLIAAVALAAAIGAAIGSSLVARVAANRPPPAAIERASTP
jgi:serine/threonine protein kinase